MVVAGCSSGFGKNLAETLLSEGEQVVVTARNPETIQHFDEKYPQTALCVRLDVTKKDTIDSAVKEAIEKFGKIDVLINNAGYCLRGAVEECTEEEIYAEFNTNFFGAVRMIQAVLPHMRKAGSGAIINYSSIAALDTSAGSAFYGAAKCALEGLSCGLRKEIEPALKSWWLSRAPSRQTSLIVRLTSIRIGFRLTTTQRTREKSKSATFLKSI